ncbi:ECF-type sigma factor [Nitrospirillum sp. BR 11164]|uniref:ECF-type sigma factor n=1 Tax=Nitrospirillum sp. BR 11164 TaxID=3104324 RepID=UPI002AFDD72B|nr:ECF-type sigma factor [Nitrospirillum sp. BR 11164]MEA1648563.1 ECF-type sigma factor [Nitrospirillum sp. BR 11164]
MSPRIVDLIEPSDAPAVLATADELLPILYADLHRVARRERAHGWAGNTLQTTALIHEAYIKMRDGAGFSDRSHFLRASALAMRHILVNHARGRLAAKRGGGAVIVPLDDDTAIPIETNDALLVEVNDALARLARLNLRLARVVECRFFAGYGDEETAQALGVTDRTVRRDWIKARAWLVRELNAGADAFDPAGKDAGDPPQAR